MVMAPYTMRSSGSPLGTPMVARYWSASAILLTGVDTGPIKQFVAGLKPGKQKQLGVLATMEHTPCPQQKLGEQAEQPPGAAQSTQPALQHLAGAPGIQFSAPVPPTAQLRQSVPCHPPMFVQSQRQSVAVFITIPPLQLPASRGHVWQEVPVQELRHTQPVQSAVGTPPCWQTLVHTVQLPAAFE